MTLPEYYEQLQKTASQNTLQFIIPSFQHNRQHQVHAAVAIAIQPAKVPPAVFESHK
jgi:hypothetical protein